MIADYLPLVPLAPPRPPTWERSTNAERLLSAFLSGRKARTLRAYGHDLADFAAFTAAGSLAEAAERLLAQGHGAANELGLRYKADLVQRGLAGATVNRRLAALRSLVKVGRLLGLVAWSLEVEGLREEPYRDTRGPGRDGFRRMLSVLANRQDAKGLRDRALLRCLYDLGLRRNEVVGLDLEDLDLEASTVMILGKGRTAKEMLTLPAPTQRALQAWVQVRGVTPGPLFSSLDRAKKGAGRLTGSAVYQIVRRLGAAVGLKTRPHALRHSAITDALDLTGGDVRAVQRFSRHRDLRTLMIYDDRRTDLAGEVARRVADAVE